MIPAIYETSKNGTIGYDIYSRLLKDRIVFLGEEVTDASANSIIAQLLFLEAEDPKKDIKLYINSPGGRCDCGLAIYDVMNLIKCDVSTVAVGLAASMGAFILSGGTKGKRFALPNSEIMIHQPLGGYQGQASDVLLHADAMKKTKDRLNKLLAKHCGQKIDVIEKATDRDNMMNAEEALKFGLIDGVL